MLYDLLIAIREMIWRTKTTFAEEVERQLVESHSELLRQEILLEERRANIIMLRNRIKRLEKRKVLEVPANVEALNPIRKRAAK